MKLLDIPLGLSINFHEMKLIDGIVRMILPGPTESTEQKQTWEHTSALLRVAKPKPIPEEPRDILVRAGNHGWNGVAFLPSSFASFLVDARNERLTPSREPPRPSSRLPILKTLKQGRRQDRKQAAWDRPGPPDRRGCALRSGKPAPQAASGSSRCS